jgi:hypothetical protein
MVFKQNIEGVSADANEQTPDSDAQYGVTVQSVQIVPVSSSFKINGSERYLGITPIKSMTFFDFCKTRVWVQ